MGKLMYKDKTYSSTVEMCTGLKYDNASSGLNAENVQDAIDEVAEKQAQLSNPNLFINGNFQIWSNGESFNVYGTTDGEEYLTPICDRWFAKHYDIDNMFQITKQSNGLRIMSVSEEMCYIYQVLDEETFNTLQGKTLTLSYSYTQSYGDVNHVEYETVEESMKIIVDSELDVFTEHTRIGLTSGINGCILNWVKLEVGEVATPCVPDSKDAIICKMKNEIDELNSNFKINNPNLLFDTSNIIYFTPTEGESYDFYGGCYYYKVGTKVYIHIGMKIDVDNVTLIYTLPEGYRPNHLVGFIGFGSNALEGVSKVQIEDNGKIKVYDGGGFVLIDIEYEAVN